MSKKVLFLLLVCIFLPFSSKAETVYVSGTGLQQVLEYYSDGVTPIFIQASLTLQSLAANQTLELQIKSDGTVLNKAWTYISTIYNTEHITVFWYGVLPEGNHNIQMGKTSTGGIASGAEGNLLISDGFGNIESMENLNFDGFYLFFSALLFLAAFYLGLNLFKK